MFQVLCPARPLWMFSFLSGVFFPRLLRFLQFTSPPKVVSCPFISKQSPLLTPLVSTMGSPSRAAGTVCVWATGISKLLAAPLSYSGDEAQILRSRIYDCLFLVLAPGLNRWVMFKHLISMCLRVLIYKIGETAMPSNGGVGRLSEIIRVKSVGYCQAR